MSMLPILISNFEVIPKDLVRAPLAVTTTSLESLTISNPRRSKRALVIILVAAPLSIMAVWGLCFILRKIFAAVVVSSSSLSTRFASASGLYDRCTACWTPARYFGDRCAACPTVSPLDSPLRYSATLNSVRDSIGAGEILLFTGVLVPPNFLALYWVFLLNRSEERRVGKECR